MIKLTTELKVEALEFGSAYAMVASNRVVQYASMLAYLSIMTNYIQQKYPDGSPYNDTDAYRMRIAGIPTYGGSGKMYLTKKRWLVSGNLAKSVGLISTKGGEPPRIRPGGNIEGTNETGVVTYMDIRDYAGTLYKKAGRRVPIDSGLKGTQVGLDEITIFSDAQSAHTGREHYSAKVQEKIGFMNVGSEGLSWMISKLEQAIGDGKKIKNISTAFVNSVAQVSAFNPPQVSATIATGVARGMFQRANRRL